MTIREMTLADRIRVCEIYKQGIDSGKATFRTERPTTEEFLLGIHNYCRYVAVFEDEVVGFVAISPVSGKPHYLGVAEVMITLTRNTKIRE